METGESLAVVQTICRNYIHASNFMFKRTIKLGF